MYPSIRFASTPAILVASLLPMAALAADPAYVNLQPAELASGANASTLLAQAEPPGSTTLASPGNTGNASGISTNPNNNTTGSAVLHGVQQPISGPPLTGFFPQVGRSLLDEGIDFHGAAFDHFLSNTTAGNITGQTYNLGVLAPSVDLDLGKLIGIPGGNIHITTAFFGLRSNIPTIITDTGGFLTGTQTTPAPSTDPVILSIFTYEQKLLDDKLSLTVGRSNAYRYFLIPNSIDVFTYFASVFNVDGDFPATPYPSWGGVANYHFTRKWYVQGAAFEDDYFRAVNNPNNFGADAASGAQIIGELGYRSEFSNAAYPANFELGGEWNTRSGLSTVKGSPIIATSRNQAYPYAGGGLFFFQGEKVLWRGVARRDGPPANIALYGTANASFDKPQPIDFDTIAGVNFTGFIPGRPFDVLELEAHYQRLSAIEANYETRLQDIFAGRGPAQNRNNWAFEVVENTQVTPWLSVKPIVEYFVHPDNLFDAAQRRRPSDGFIAGVLTSISLGRLLGTSNKPF